MSFDIQEELKKIPQKPGVYLMKNASQEIIYVGKAINLKNRVRQYFQNPSNQLPKVRSMVKNIVEFEYIVTDTEMEALILECNLIKKERPRYNIVLKDDKNYPYIKITTNEDFPRVFMTRRVQKDKQKYLGPYTSAADVKETIEILYNLWPVRHCQKSLPREMNKERPCLNYHIGRCKAPCAGAIDKEQYGKYIEEITQFLGGSRDFIIKQMEVEMNAYAESLDFEKAADIRNKIQSVKKLSEKQKMEGGSFDQDVIAFASEKDNVLAQIFFVRGGKMIGREHFLLNNVSHFSKEEVTTGFVKQFYAGTPFIPKEILLETEILDKENISQWLSYVKGQKVSIVIPQKGEKLRLVELVSKNAAITLAQFGEKLQREMEKTTGAVNELKSLLGIESSVTRIEAFDISNTQGFESVGSMVVFENGKPKRSDYRKFKIKTVIGSNDYKSMEEVIYRRFSHALKEKEELKNMDEPWGKFIQLPQLILIDGGRGHVSSAENALKNFDLSVIVCGMVKDEKHRTRGIIYKNEELIMKSSSESFKLLTRIQDEAHRFAVEYHRKLRSKSQLHSALDDIDGIGPKRRKGLLKKFGSLQEIQKADVKSLAEAENMNEKTAKSVYQFFHPEIAESE